MSETLTGLAAVEALCNALSRDLFGGRLRRVKVYWDSDPNYAVRISPATGELWLGQHMAFHSKRGLCAILTHELGHLAAVEEPAHGPKWMACMRRVGVCPGTGNVIAGGRLDQWLRSRGW